MQRSDFAFGKKSRAVKKALNELFSYSVIQQLGNGKTLLTLLYVLLH